MTNYGYPKKYITIHWQCESAILDYINSNPGQHEPCDIAEQLEIPVEIAADILHALFRQDKINIGSPTPLNDTYTRKTKVNPFENYEPLDLHSDEVLLGVEEAKEHTVLTIAYRVLEPTNFNYALIPKGATERLINGMPLYTSATFGEIAYIKEQLIKAVEKTIEKWHEWNQLQGD